MSKNRAAVIGRSQYDVFTGADIWPGRNQGNFLTNGNAFMGNLHENTYTAFTSLGLFAPNCIFNHSIYTNFNNDPTDYASFYAAENKMFAGADQNPATIDATGWKGFCNWVPETSVITSPYFSTNFSTGHGIKKFSQGNEISNASWHNMDLQDILPTWQWAFTPNSTLSARWDFDDAYANGNSLKVSGSLAANTPIDLMLFKTKIPTTFDMGFVESINMMYKKNGDFGPTLKLLLVFSDEPNQKYEFNLNDNASNDWSPGYASLDGFGNREIAMIGLRFNSGTAIADYSVNFGALDFSSPTLGTDTFDTKAQYVTVAYPQDKIMFRINWPNAQKINYTIFDLQGRKVKSNSLHVTKTYEHRLDAGGMESGTYIVKFTDEKNTSVTKQILVK